MALERLIAAFGRQGVEAQTAEDIPEALSLAMSIAGARDLICVAGSLFVVAEAIEQASILR
jgi:folylpolyglutamate synthase/dihydropteroate synthase